MYYRCLWRAVQILSLTHKFAGDKNFRMNVWNCSALAHLSPQIIKEAGNKLVTLLKKEAISVETTVLLLDPGVEPKRRKCWWYEQRDKKTRTSNKLFRLFQKVALRWTAVFFGLPLPIVK